MRYCVHNDMEIYYLDECCHTMKEPLYAWTNKGKACSLTHSRGTTNINVCCVISKDGIIHYKTYEKYLDERMFIDFLKELYKKIPRQKKIGLFYDGLKIHLCKKV